MKNILNTWSARTLRISFTILFVLVFIVCFVNFLDIMFFKSISNDQCGWIPTDTLFSKMRITQIVPGGVADKAGLKEGDILLKIDGKGFKFNDAMNLINSVPYGNYATYLIERNGVQFETKIKIVKVFDIAYLSRFLLGLGFLLVGYVVIIAKPKGKTQVRFAHYSILSMLFFSLLDLRITLNDNLFKVILLIGCLVIALIFAPPQFVRFFFYFPVKRVLKNKKLWTIFLFSSSVSVVTIIILDNFFGFLRGYRKIIGFIPYLFYFGGLILFIYNYFKYVEISRKKQIRPILISIIFGGAAFIYTLVISNTYQFAIFLQPSLFLPSLLIITVPVAFGYSIFHYRLMDIDLVIKKSLIYGIITATIAATYILFIFGFGSLLGLILGQSDNTTLTIIAFLVIAFAFDPYKRRLQEWIDRIFYQERYNYQKALLEFSQEIPRLMHLDQISNSIIHRISNTMHIEKMAFIVCDEKEGCSNSVKNIDEIYCSFEKKPNGLIDLLLKTKSPQSFALLKEEPDSVKISEEDKEKILKSEIILVVPIFLQDRLIGMVNVGPKISGKIYSQEDVDLLSTVASQAAIAIENARLHKNEIENQKFQEELSIARRIQKELLPQKNPVIEGLDISGISIPALTVGGDYFDYIVLDQNKLLIVVGDVSGKGMSAALYMSKIQGMVQIAAHMYKTPKEMLIEVNRRIYDGIERKSFITMILALYDLEKKLVTICRAGHNKPLIRTNGNLEYIGSDGMGLGLERGPIFESTIQEVSVPLAKKSLYFFYTDGLNEAMNFEYEEFGELRLYDLLNYNQNLKSKEIQDIISNEVEKFRGDAEQNDDLTMVIVKSE